ncbi:BglG family transcription antiterminator [Bacillus sp. 522_BSPC]|uniref:BglG family transcription antiterminator n=1 Tax=Bacillus sp. 522_BSPC TaxID=1579338 RepID=UPI0006601627|nr:BglG family transcription antiterminator [Bacillus sp. 522_BSPC]
MNLNKKCMAILRDLLETPDYIKIQELANKLDISERAIRYNINKLDEFLFQNGFNCIERHHLKGIKLNRVKEVTTFIAKFLEEHSPYQYILSKEERFIYILTRLLGETEPISYSDLQDKIGISKSTLDSELQLINEYIDPYGLTLERKRKHGVLIQGDEKQKRSLLNKMILGTISAKDIFQYIRNRRVLSKINTIYFHDVLSEIDIQFIDDLIFSAEQELDKEFDDQSYMNLLTHLMVAVKRTFQHREVDISEAIISNISDTREYTVAKHMMEELAWHYAISIPDMEAGYIALQLLGAKSIKKHPLDQQELNGDELYLASLKMVDELESIYQCRFGEEKEKIVEGLLLHLKPAIYRIKYHLTLENPMFDEIIFHYEELFQHTKKITKYLEEHLDQSFNDHEISYITLHFAAALEKAQDNMEARKKVLLVCGAGISSANILSNQLQKAFHVEIVNTVSFRALQYMDSSSYDLIISTIDIPEMNNKKYLKVNVFLTESDYELISQFLHSKFSQGNYYEVNLNKVNKLLEAVQSHGTVKDVYKLQYQFMKILMDKKEDSTSYENLSIRNIINERTIKLKAKVGSWEEAIKEGTDLLYDDKSATSPYYETVIKHFHEYGPYMVVAPGVVLSHARPEDGALKLALSLVTFKNGIDFKDDFKEDVRLVVTLTVVDKTSHLEILGQLMKLLTNKDDVEKIIKANSKEDIFQIFNEYSQ